MINQIQYVPVLKWKQGEQKAVEALAHSVKQRLVPLIEIPPIDWDYENDVPKKTIDEHLSKIGDSLQRSWGMETPVFLDLHYIDESERLNDGLHPLNYVANECRNRGVSIIPVTSPIRDNDYQNEVLSILQQDGLGVCFRLREIDFANLQLRIDSLLSLFSVNPSEVDLVLDYEYVDSKDEVRTTLFLVGLLNATPYLKEWRNVIITGTSFPPDLSSVSSNSIDEIKRSEWLIWNKIISTSSIARRPVFGDYAVANPAPFEADPRFINMSANIRYTARDKFIIFKGRMIKRYGGSQYHQLALQVTSHPEYSGAQFSNGDLYIHEVAKNNDGPGNATNWRTSGTNHHLSFVVNELATVTVP